MPDVLEFGHERRRPRWVVPLLILVLLAGAVVVARKAGHSDKPAVATPSQAPTAVVPAPPDPSAGTVITEESGRALLGVTAGWELFARGPDTVVRIELARGRVTRTTVTPPGSSGPVSFVVGRNWAVVRPLDVVPATVVIDGEVPRPAAGALGESGPAFPGPDPDHLWAPAAGNGAAMSLVGPDGKPSGVSITLPTSTGGAEPDDTGNLLVRDTGGVYVARPGGLRRVTTGDVLAAGPSRWLTLECDDQHRCVATVIDRDTAARRVLPGLSLASVNVTGAISPDGAVAALYEGDPNGTLTLHLIRLSTGADRRVDVPLAQYPDQGTMVWSPDSRWLFMAGGGGRLFPVDAATGAVHDLGVQLPALSQVAIRPAAGQK